MDQTAAAKNLIVLSGDDARFVERARSLSKELHREVYRCLSIICELDAAGDCLAEDEKRFFNELRGNWAEWYAEDLELDEPETLKAITG